MATIDCSQLGASHVQPPSSSKSGSDIGSDYVPSQSGSDEESLDGDEDVTDLCLSPQTEPDPPPYQDTTRPAT